MAKRKSNEARMTLYRLVGLSSTDDAIREKYREPEDDRYHYSHKPVSVGDTKAVLYWGTVESDRAGWTTTVNGLTKENLEVGNASSSAVLVIPQADADEEVSEGEADNNGSESDGSEVSHFEAWAITFGMGFQMLEQHYIDPGFGQRVAIRCAKSEGLNVLSKTTLDESPRMVRSTIPSGGSLRRFGFEELGDFSTGLVVEGCIEGIGNPKKPIKVKGADSLNIPLSKSPKTLLENLDQIKTVLDKEPASPELAALEHLSLVKDSIEKQRLDQSLIEAIGDMSDQVALSYPYEIIDEFGQVSSFKIIGTRQRKPYDYLPAIDDLLAPILEEDDEEQRQKKLDRLSVVLYKSPDDEDTATRKTPIKKWLTFQKTIDGKRYFLLNNRWYVTDGDYVKNVERKVKEIFDRKPYFAGIPDWPIYELPNDKDAEKKANAELNYNRRIAKKLNGLCLDQQLIWPKGSASGIEACDVLLPEGVFVHVKHVSSSTPASHLLAQALVATDLLRTDEDAQGLLKKKIESVGGNPKDYDTKPRRVVIVMARNDEPITAEKLFTFTKINLVRHDQRLASMDVELNVVPVVRKKQPK